MESFIKISPHGADILPRSDPPAVAAHISFVLAILILSLKVLAPVTVNVEAAVKAVAALIFVPALKSN